MVTVVEPIAVVLGVISRKIAVRPALASRRFRKRAVAPAGTAWVCFRTVVDHRGLHIERPGIVELQQTGWLDRQRRRRY